MKRIRTLPANTSKLPRDVALCRCETSKEFHIITQHVGIRVWNREARRWTCIGSGVTICACGKVLDPRKSRVSIINAEDFPYNHSICLSCLRATVGV